MPGLKTNQAGLTLIKSFESLSLDAYKCPAGIWTVGYGHTGEDVYEGIQITEEDAETLLQSDLCDAEAAVNDCVSININGNQFSSLVSFVFNCGAYAFRKSTLLKKINAGDKYGAADEFLRWSKAGGRVLKGLLRRREAERALFMAEDVT